LEDARKKADQFQITCSELKTKLEEVEKALEEEKLENSASSALAEVLKADSKDLQKQQIQEWHSRNLQLRIKVRKSNIFYVDKLNKYENRIWRVREKQRSWRKSAKK